MKAKCLFILKFSLILCLPLVPISLAFSWLSRTRIYLFGYFNHIIIINLATFSIIHNHFEAAGESHKIILLFAESMATPYLPARNVVNPVSALNLERDVVILLNKRKIAAGIFVLGEGDKVEFCKI